MRKASPSQEPTPEEHNATAGGVTLITLSLLVFVFSFLLWPLLLLVVFVLALFTGGLGLYLLPVAALITLLIHATCALFGAGLAAIGLRYARRSSHPVAMPVKGVVCLALNASIVAAACCGVWFVHVHVPGLSRWLLTGEPGV